jgi:hypothetical protein
MNDEFESLNSRIPDFASALAARAMTGKTPPPPGTFDPYQAIIQKKREAAGEVAPPPVQSWPEEDVQVLKDYCQKMGIFGFNTKLHPRVVLAQLKRQFGEDFTGVPLDQRVPEGYQKLGEKTTYGPNNTYSQANRRQVIHG